MNTLTLATGMVGMAAGSAAGIAAADPGSTANLMAGALGAAMPFAVTRATRINVNAAFLVGAALGFAFTFSSAKQAAGVQPAPILV